MDDSRRAAPKSVWSSHWAGSAIRIGAGCAIVLLFVATFLCMLLVVPEMVSPTALKVIPWLLLLALVVVLPFVLEYLRPLVSQVKFGNLLEFTFRQVQAEGVGSDDLAEKLKQLDPSGITAQVYASWMQTSSLVIIDKVKDLQQGRAEVLTIDLGAGNVWVIANLFFLALLVSVRTGVRQLAFTATQAQTERRFVGMCAPEDLIGRVGTQLPSLLKAQSQTEYRYGGLDTNLGSQFFVSLNQALSGDGQAQEYKRWVTESWLRDLLGTSLQQGQVEWRDRLESEAYRFILAYPHRYVAAVRAGQYLFPIDQCRVSLDIARSAARQERHP